jgi:DNA-binding MarR family transcriptional regulator
MRPSSQYAKLACMSSKTAVRVRRRLVDAGYLREHTVDSAGRGRSSILLEVLPAGLERIAQHERRSEDV